MMKMVIYCVGFSLVACSSSSTEMNEGIGTEAEPLSFQEHCDTAPADATLASGESVLAPRDATSAQCAHAYLVDVTTGPHPFMNLIWEDILPTTQGDCLQSKLFSYVWKKSGSSTTPVDALVLGGQWAAGQCSHDWLRTPASISPNTSYRFAISGRQVHADGSYAKRRSRLFLQELGAGGALGAAPPL